MTFRLRPIALAVAQLAAFAASAESSSASQASTPASSLETVIITATKSARALARG